MSVGFDEHFDKELIQMWQENTFPSSGSPPDLSHQLSGMVKKFDQWIRWRNIIEYSAGVVVLIRSVFDIASGERLLFAPLTGIAAVIFVMTYMWKQHRIIQRLDPVANVTTYRAALLERLDRQIRLLHSVRYWYVLPCWIFFVTVLASGILQGRRFVPLMMEFLTVTALCVVVIWLNERVGLERQRVMAIGTDSNEDL
jgi:hypothetical protein